MFLKIVIDGKELKKHCKFKRKYILDIIFLRKISQEYKYITSNTPNIHLKNEIDTSYFTISLYLVGLFLVKLWRNYTIGP